MKVEELTLRKDLVKAATSMEVDEVRYLVDAYYMIQEHRKAAANQHRASIEAGEPADLLAWVASSQEYLETQIRRALDRYGSDHPVGEWAKSIRGIGPVITAGLLAYIDVTKANTAGKVWAYAGLVPGQKREKGKRINWNPNLKRLCFLIGESFVKVSSHEDSFYGQAYKSRKEYEQARNERLEYKDQAEHILATKNIGKTTDAYKWYSAGMLPPAHIHQRAKRWTVKLFLSHFHDKLYRHYYKEAPPLPYPMEHLGHPDYIAPPVQKTG